MIVLTAMSPPVMYHGGAIGVERWGLGGRRRGFRVQFRHRARTRPRTRHVRSYEFEDAFEGDLIVWADRSTGLGPTKQMDSDRRENGVRGGGGRSRTGERRHSFDGGAFGGTGGAAGAGGGGGS